MPFRNRPGVDQLDIPAVPTVGELIVLEDVAGSPGLPALDGSQLTGITATVSLDDALIDDNTAAVVVDDNIGNILVDG